MNTSFWRKWHRWISFPTSLFVLFAAVTGVMVAVSEFFGEAEEIREANRKMVSPVTLQSSLTEWNERLARAFETAAKESGNAPVDQVTIQFKGKEPTITVYTGKPTGGEDRRFVVGAASGALLETGAYVDKPFLHRLHSGEAFGDGGLVAAMAWGTVLAVLVISGFIIYLTMWRPGLTGWRKLFW